MFIFILNFVIKSGDQYQIKHWLDALYTKAQRGVYLKALK